MPSPPDPPPRSSRLRRFLLSWQLPAAVALLLAVALALAVSPRPVPYVLPVDGTEGWRAAEAPVRREVVWRAAQPFDVPLSDLPAEGEFVTPRLVDSGTVLYFTRRDEHGRADVWRSRLADGDWSQPEPVAEINSPHDDLGPSFSPDGRTMWFYSDRPGGLGGFDLYVSVRTGGAWGPPENLGPQVNSPYDEYEPAPSPDGLALYFASDRTERAASVAPRDAERRPWSTTLRVRRHAATFDLYRARRSGAQEAWSAAVPLDALDRPQVNDGAPFVSPDGAFLYFASDRTARPGEVRNLDLYRARIGSEGFGPIENLGPGVNTAAHETEPGLSPEGFALTFSSDREGSDRLYVSRAGEVETATVWEARNAGLATSLWWRALFATLVVAAVLAVLLFLAGRLGTLAQGARFVLGSVMLHLLFLLMLFLWKLPQVMEIVVSQVQKVQGVPDIPSESSHQSHEDGRESFEKLADLPSLQPTEPVEIVRTESEPLAVPEASDAPLPVLPAEVLRRVPVEQRVLIPVPEMRPQPVRELQEFVRRPVERPVRPVELAEVPERLVEPPDVRPPDAPEAQPVEVERRRVESVAVPEPVATPDRPVPAVPRTTRVPVAAAAPREPDPNPAAAETPTIPVRRTSPSREVAALDEVVPQLAPSETGPVPRTAPAAETTPVARTATPSSTAAPTDVPVPAADVPAPAPAKPLVDPQPPRDVPVSQLAATTPAPLPAPLTRVVVRPQAAPGAIVEDSPALAPAETSDKRAALEIAAQNVAVEKSNAPVPNAAAAPIALPEADRPPAPAAKATEVAVVSPTFDVPVPQSPVPQSVASPLARRERRAPSAAVTVAAPAETSPLAPSEPNDTPDVQTPAPGAVTVERRAETPGTTIPVAAADAPSPTSTSPATAVRPTTTVVERAADVEPTNAPGPAPAVPLPASLRRTGAGPRPAVAEIAEAAPVVPGAPGSEPESIAGPTTVGAPAVSIERSTIRSTTSPIPVPEELAGPARRGPQRLAVGAPGLRPNEAAPQFGPFVSRLQRERARATRVAFAQDSVDLRSMFTLRDAQSRSAVLEVLGATDASEKAVNLGLEWLAGVQEKEGHWALQKHGGATVSDTAGTAFGVLPFLAAGHVHDKPGKYQETVRKALDWLVAHQKPDGDLFVRGGNAHGHMYSHGVGTIALCEAYGLTRDPKLEQPARRALDFIAKAQHKGGGWRYQPGEAGDMSVVGWQMMALKSGEMAGLSVPRSVYDGVARFLASVEEKKGGRFGYQNGSPTFTMTAEAMLCLQFLGERRDSPRMRRGADYLLAALPEKSQRDSSYGWYYATQAMYHMQGDYWEAWEPKMRELLVATQVQSGRYAGTWDPRDQWESQGGRVLSTSFKVLMLEVYYRHLPLFEQLRD